MSADRFAASPLAMTPRRACRCTRPSRAARQTAFQFKVPVAILPSARLRQPFILSQPLGRLFPGSQGAGDVMVQTADQASDVAVRQLHFVTRELELLAGDGFRGDGRDGRLLRGRRDASLLLKEVGVLFPVRDFLLQLLYPPVGRGR